MVIGVGGPRWLAAAPPLVATEVVTSVKVATVSVATNSTNTIADAIESFSLTLVKNFGELYGNL